MTKKKMYFKDVRDLDDYFNQDTIACLECGVELKSLGAHIKTHNLSARQYKAKYNIPQGRGLASAGTKAKLRDIRNIQFDRMTKEERLAERKRSKEHFRKIAPLGLKAKRESSIRHGVYKDKCKECGEEFEAHAHKNRNYCSQACSNLVTSRKRDRNIIGQFS